MPNFFQKNRDLFAKAHPLEAPKLDHVDDAPLPVRLTVTTPVSRWNLGGDEGPFPSETRDGFAVLSPDKKLYVLYGVGDGSFVERLLGKDGVQELLVFEPSITLFRDLLTQKDFSQVLSDQRVHMILGTETGEYIRFIEEYFTERIYRFCYAGNVGNLVVPGVHRIKACEPYFLKFAEAFKFAIQNIRVRAQHCREDALYGMANALQNLSRFKNLPPLTCLESQFRDLSAVIVCPGPSLKHSIPYLKRVADRALIITCDSAVKILLAEGIVPHVMCSLERVSLTRDYFVGLNADQPSLMVVPSVIHPDTLSEIKLPTLALHRDMGPDPWLFPGHKTSFLGQTVSQMCLRIAGILGCREIYLVGVDAAFDPDTGGSHHDKAEEIAKAGGSFIKDDEEFSVFELEGYDGEKKLTWTYWFMDATIMGGMIANDQLNVKRVTPKKYGIPIRHAERVDPEALLKIEKQSQHQAVAVAKKIIQSYRAPHFDFAGLRQQTLDFLRDQMVGCEATLFELNQFFYNQCPKIRKNLPAYREFFIRMEKRREALSLTPHDMYQRVLHHILQGVYAETGYQIHAAYSRWPEENAHRASTVVREYQKWFNELLLWCERVRYLVEVTWHES